MIDDATFFLPVRELAARIVARKLSPVELTTGCLERLETMGPRYNAVVTVMRESALAEIVRRRYGKHLTPEQLEAVARELDGRLQGGKRMRETRLANGDEPDFTFHA